MRFRVIRRGLKDGEPCRHRSCLAHISHPCEGCGRIGGRTLPLVFDDRWLGFVRGTGWDESPWIRRATKDGYEFGIAHYEGTVFMMSKRRADGKGINYQTRANSQDEAWDVACKYAAKHGGWA